MSTTLLLALIGCSRTNGAPPGTPATTSAAEAADPAPGSASPEGDAAAAPTPGLGASGEPAAPPPPVWPSPAELYAQCEGRVEKPQKDGECAADADCATGGCGGEVCAPASAVKELMTSCEQRPCFEVLDVCGCHDGRCTWTLKAESPPPKRAPGSLPQ